MPEIKQTISVSRGKTAIEHDLREHTPNNVDASMSKYNVVLINELGGKSLAEYTNEYMKPYIEEYNKKQRRSDRKKSYDICFKIRNSCFIRYYKCKDPILKCSSEFSLHNLK